MREYQIALEVLEIYRNAGYFLEIFDMFRDIGNFGEILDIIRYTCNCRLLPKYQISLETSGHLAR